MKRLLALLPFVALGPLSGPLAWGAVRCWRAKRYAMAGVYVVGVVEVFVGLPLLAGSLLEVVNG